MEGKSQHSFAILLRSGSDFQVYYTIRNSVYFDLHHWALNRFTLELNKWVFMALLYAFGIWWRKWDRLALIVPAVQDGEKGRLGARATGGASLDR